MKKLLFMLVVLYVCTLPASPLSAEVKFSGGMAMGWPQGDISHYAFGAVGIGGTGRIGISVAKNLSLTGQFSYIDFGVEQGFIPRDRVNSTLTLDIATDFYMMQFGPGLSWNMKSGYIRPYFDLLGGITYYSTYSRVSSRNIAPPLVRYSETSGYTWYAGGGGGLRLLIWKPERRREEPVVDAIYFDMRLGYLAGGNIEVLDWRAVRFYEGELLMQNLSSRSGMLLANVGLMLVF